MSDVPADALGALCLQYLGRVADHWSDDAGTRYPFYASALAPVFAPPLTAAEQAVYADLQSMASLGLQTLTLAQYQARKADVAALRAYMALASPTTAQTVTAFHALVRVVGAMLRVQVS